MREEEDDDGERVGEELEGCEHKMDRVLKVRLMNEEYCEFFCGGECG